MVASVQTVILINVECFNVKNDSYNEKVSQIYLCCLRLLTEFGAQTKKGNENLLWAFKFYDSKVFKPDLSHKVFLDFTQESLKKFETELEAVSASIKNVNSSKENEQLDGCHSHSYILNKSLQEILLDYNWDRPDISSPEKTKKLKNSNLPHKLKQKKQNELDSKELNYVIVFTSFPCDSQEVETFVGGVKTNLFQSIIDNATLSGYKNEKRLNLHFIHSTETIIDQSTKVSLQSNLKKLNGNIHMLNLLVQCNDLRRYFLKKDKNVENVFISKNEENVSGGSLFLQNFCWKNKRKLIPRSRLPQQGPVLVWEDCEGIYFIKIELKLTEIQLSSSRKWGNMVVKSLTHGNHIAIVGLSMESSNFYTCYSLDPLFSIVMSFLLEQSLMMILQLECGTLAALAPWIGGIGCIVLFSTSCLCMLSSKSLGEKDESVEKFVSRSVKRCLKKCPPFFGNHASTSKKLLHPQMLKTWYPSSEIAGENLKVQPSKKLTKCPAMLERLQKKYRPQMPRPLSASNLPPPAFIDATEPAAAAGVSQESAALSMPSAILNSKHNVSRAQKLVKKSKIVTAQMKVKEQKAEELENEAADKRRQEQAQNRVRRSMALVEESMKTMNSPQNVEELASYLVHFRDSGGRLVGIGDEPEDIYATAQCVVNLALRHLKNYPGSHTNDLLSVAQRGVLLSAKEVNKTIPEDHQCRQYKLQTLLHLETLWVLGYSPTSKSNDQGTDEEKNDFGEQFVEEILKLLRMMSLKYSPASVGEFLRDVVVPNFHMFLGQTLAEIFEELNQPLPNCLAAFATTDEDLISPLKPSSMKSYTSSIHSNELNSLEEAGPSFPISRVPSKMLLKREPSNRQIAVLRPKRSSRVSRQLSGRKRASQSKSTEVKKVCRNLFEGKSTTKEKLKRHHTVASFRSSSRLANLRTPVKNEDPSNRLSKGQTPDKALKNALDVEARKRKLSTTRTPLRSRVTGLDSTPTPKKAKLCVPETPAHQVRETIYNKQRLRKSTGQTIVLESPDVKGINSTGCISRSRLSLTRKSSFYSGGVSRNFEKGKQQLRASQIMGAVQKRNSSASDSANVASILFSEIINSNKGKSYRQNQEMDDRYSQKCAIRTPLKESSSPNLPERRQLHFGLEDSSLIADDKSWQTMETMSPFLGFSESPSLCRIKRTLSLGTPVKSNQTPVKLCLGSQLDVNEAVSYVTPSKKVQFNFECTPSKVKSCSKAATPKSILKTPSKSPGKTPCKTGVSPFLGFQSPNVKKKIKYDFFTPVSANDVKNSIKKFNLATSNGFKEQPDNKKRLNFASPITSIDKPSQLEALLHSPITINMKKSPKLTPSSLRKSSPEQSLPDDKECLRSPQKDCLDKELIHSPIKYLKNSSTELELVSPSKYSIYSATESDDFVIDFDYSVLNSYNSSRDRTQSSVSLDYEVTEKLNRGDSELILNRDSDILQPVLNHDSERLKPIFNQEDLKELQPILNHKDSERLEPILNRDSEILEPILSHDSERFEAMLNRESERLEPMLTHDSNRLEPTLIHDSEEPVLNHCDSEILQPILNHGDSENLQNGIAESESKTIDPETNPDTITDSNNLNHVQGHFNDLENETSQTLHQSLLSENHYQSNIHDSNDTQLNPDYDSNLQLNHKSNIKDSNSTRLNTDYDSNLQLNHESYDNLEYSKYESVDESNQLSFIKNPGKLSSQHEDKDRQNIENSEKDLNKESQQAMEQSNMNPSFVVANGDSHNRSNHDLNYYHIQNSNIESYQPHSCIESSNQLNLGPISTSQDFECQKSIAFNAISEIFKSENDPDSIQACSGLASVFDAIDSPTVPFHGFHDLDGSVKPYPVLPSQSNHTLDHSSNIHIDFKQSDSSNLQISTNLCSNSHSSPSNSEHANPGQEINDLINTDPVRYAWPADSSRGIHIDFNQAGPSNSTNINSKSSNLDIPTSIMNSGHTNHANPTQESRSDLIYTDSVQQTWFTDTTKTISPVSLRETPLFAHRDSDSGIHSSIPSDDFRENEDIKNEIQKLVNVLEEQY